MVHIPALLIIRMGKTGYTQIEANNNNTQYTLSRAYLDTFVMSGLEYRHKLLSTKHTRWLIKVMRLNSYPHFEYANMIQYTNEESFKLVILFKGLLEPLLLNYIQHRCANTRKQTCLITSGSVFASPNHSFSGPCLPSFAFCSATYFLLPFLNASETRALGRLRTNMQGQCWSWQGLEDFG